MIAPVMQTTGGLGFNTTVTVSPSTGTVPGGALGAVILATLSFVGPNSNAAITFTNTVGLTFALVGRATKADNSATVALYVAIVASAFSSSSFTFSIASGSSGAIVMTLEGFTGVDHATPLGGFALDTGSGVTSTVPSFATAAAEYAILAFHNGTPNQPNPGGGGLPNGMVFPPLTGATLLGGSWGGFGFQDISFYSTASLSGTIAAQSVTWPLSGTWAASGYTLKPATSATHYSEALSETVGGAIGESLVVLSPTHYVAALSETASPPIGESLGDAYTPGGPVAITLLLGDVALIVLILGEIDAAIAFDDVAADRGLRTSVILSLFTDRIAEDDDILPGGDRDRHGWWGDEFNDVEGDKIGSRLWLLDRSARRPEVAKRAEEYIRESLAWMIVDKVTDKLDVTVEIAGADLLYTIGINRPTGPVKFKFRHVWDALATEGP